MFIVIDEFRQTTDSLKEKNVQLSYICRKMFSKPHIKEQQEVDVLEEVIDPFRLIVWNDDVNTFDWVIETLVDVCGHTAEQAEQCAWLIHQTGKYAVKHGSYDDLRLMCDEITDRGIGATVESTS